MNQDNLNFLENIWKQVLINPSYSLCLRRKDNFCELIKSDTEQVTEHYLLEGTDGNSIYPTIYKTFLESSKENEDSVFNFVIRSDLENDSLVCLINGIWVKFILSEPDDYAWLQIIVDEPKQLQIIVDEPKQKKGSMSSSVGGTKN